MLKRLLHIFILIAVLYTAGFVMFAWRVTTLKPYDGKAEGIVVLTGGDGRIDTALRLLIDHKATRLLVSGVHATVTMDDLLQRYRAPDTLAAQIDLGHAAHDTLGNADETAAWIAQHHLQSVIVVTAHYHMPRTLLHLGALLPDTALYPYPVRPPLFQRADWVYDRATWQLLLRDYTKLLLTYPQIIFTRK